MVITSPVDALTLVLRIASVGVFLVTVETLARRNVLRDDGLMSWVVGGLRQAYLVRKPLGPLLDFSLRYPNICVLLALRGLLAAVIVLGPTWLATSPWCLCPMALLLLLFAVRHPYGQDGADQMALIIFVGGAVATRWREAG